MKSTAKEKGQTPARAGLSKSILFNRPPRELHSPGGKPDC